MSDTISTIRSDFITLMGQMVESHGLSPISGRIMGLLIFDGEARSFSDLATELGVSRGSISANARLLVARGSIMKENRPGDRQDYFRISDQSFDVMLQTLMQRMLDMSGRVRELSDRLPADDAEGDGPRRRLGGLSQFYAAMALGMRQAQDHLTGDE
ncbi:hypothetical protein C4N9_10090 [Pararhodobacter marinus]|uniref:HTH marR-type domain-containing protein n=1 Tax=Pararhodobacter marinus TaxID=2184063 RepID=A0A2U2CBA6_9RHOB|nr:MarR family transcriptional regulator [Pararhodobacter marinus]PWE29150.1 hypothetical protein C4N9_10090 [Pararhodobacter marinus]